MSLRTPKDRQLSIWLPDSVITSMTKIAEHEGISRSAVARRAVLRDLRRHESDRDDDRWAS